MPAGVHVTIDGDYAEVEVPDRALRGKIARRLVDAAHPDGWRVETVTVRRPVPAFRAPLAIVRAAGLIDEPDPAPHDHTHWSLYSTPLGYDENRAQAAPDSSANGGVLHTVTLPELVFTPPPEPPRTGKGSGLAEWQRFLDAVLIPCENAKTRSELIACWDKFLADRKA